MKTATVRFRTTKDLKMRLLALAQARDINVSELLVALLESILPPAERK